MNKALRRFLQKKACYVAAKTGMSTRLMMRRDAVPRETLELMSKEAPLPLPVDVQFEITMKCNLRCVMCHQDTRRKNSSGDLCLDDVRRIIDNLRCSSIGRIKLIGGEVFLRNDILDVIEYLERKNIGVSITTNGTLLSDAIVARLRDFNCLLGVVFSIDGLADRHNAIRGNARAFSLTMEGLRAASRFLPLTKVTCVLQKDTLGDIEEMIRFARDNNVDILSFLLESFVTTEETSATLDMLADTDTSGVFLTPSDATSYGFSLDDLIAADGGIKRYSRKYGVMSYLGPPAAAADPASFYGGKMARGTTCGYLNRLVITEEGNVLGCPFINLVHGNLLHQSLEEIWNSPSFIQYRSLFARRGAFPVCRRCCALSNVVS